MPGHTRSRTGSVLVVSVLLIFLSFTANAQIRFDLPSQPLAQALTTLGSLANLNIYFDAPSVDGIQAPALKAELSPDDALARLLAGTRLRAVRVDENTIRVVTATGAKDAQRAHDTNTGASYAPGAVHLAYARTGDAMSGAVSSEESMGPDASGSSGPTQRRLDEVIVTAQKRNERLQDVPVPVTALNADSLVEQNQVRILDYYSSVPGLNFTTNGSGDANVSIRGVTTGAGNGNPTVGITVDDVPFGSSSSLAGGGPAPDIDPNDLTRVEVLRGPQGTLYGASSIGGLLKFVTVDPSTDAVTSDVQASTRGVTNSPNLGYNFRGAVNVPLDDTFAIRASAFTRRDPGYIDDVQTGERGVNRVDVDGGRLSALWRPEQDFSLKLSALVQHSTANGSSDVDLQPGLQGLQQSYLRGAGGYEKNIQAYSATVKAKLGGVDLTAVTGFNINKSFESTDFTPALGPYTQYGLPGSGFNGFGVSGTSLLNDGRTSKFTQEVRLSAPLGPHFEWLFGVFYTHEESHFMQQIFPVDPASGADVGSWFTAVYPTTYAEYAAFADLTLHVTDRFDVQFGGRESDNRQTYSEVDNGLYESVFNGLPPPVVNPEVVTKDNSFTYLVTPRYRLSEDLMMYARLASGYRPGGPNPTCTVFGVPCRFGPDKTQNYEIGVKGDALGHTLSFDASLYYIDWKDIQLSVTDPLNYAFYYTNASRAKSQGIELSADSRPLRGMTLSAWVSWDDAVLTEGFPPGVPGVSAVGVAGDRLPYSSRFSGHLAAKQEWLIANRLTGFVGASASYVGNRESYFTASTQRQDLPGYTQIDARVGVRYDSWTIDVFTNNVTDQRGVLSGGLGTINPVAFDYIEPRTLGLSLSTRF